MRFAVKRRAASAIAATASLSQLIGAESEYSPHPVGSLMHLAGLALLMALGFPILLCDLLRESFALGPLGQWPAIADLLPRVIALVQRAFMLAMLLAAPFILGGFLFQVLSGMVSKVMPALPVMFIAAPGAILMALLALLFISSATFSSTSCRSKFASWICMRSRWNMLATLRSRA